MLNQALHKAADCILQVIVPNNTGPAPDNAADAVPPRTACQSHTKAALYAINTALHVASTGIGLATGLLLFNSEQRSHQTLGVSSVVLNTLEAAMLILETQRLIVGPHAASTFRISAVSGASAAVATASAIMLGLRSEPQSLAQGCYAAAVVAAADGLISVIDHGARLLGHSPQTQLFGHTA